MSRLGEPRAEQAVPAYSSPAARLSGAKSRAGVRNPLNRDDLPAYGHVAPVSWLVSHDVRQGREQLNFSLWTGYSRIERKAQRQAIAEAVQTGQMPPLLYRLMHPARSVTPAEKALLAAWLEADPH